jgi:hypothetical protein
MLVLRRRRSGNRGLAASRRARRALEVQSTRRLVEAELIVQPAKPVLE